MKVIEITIDNLAYHSMEDFTMVKWIIFAIGLIAFCNQFDNTLGIIHTEYRCFIKENSKFFYQPTPQIWILIRGLSIAFIEINCHANQIRARKINVSCFDCVHSLKKKYIRYWPYWTLNGIWFFLAPSSSLGYTLWFYEVYL